MTRTGFDIAGRSVKLRHRLRLAPLVLVASVAVPAVAGCGSAHGLASHATAATTTDRVVVDVRARRQVMQGFGASERVWSDPHLARAPNVTVPVSAQRAILTALYRWQGLTRMRNVLDAGVQPAPNAPYNFTNPPKLGPAHVALVKQARPYGLKAFFPEPVYLESWMTPQDPGAYVNWAMAMLRYWRSHGAEPPYYSPLNEPQVAKNFPPQWMHDVVLELGRRMRAAGFKTKLVMPDDENPIDAYRRAVAVLSDPRTRQYVAAIAYHIYRIGGPTDWAKLRRLGARYKLPLWMTEYNSQSYRAWPGALDWAVKMSQLVTIGGVSAIDYEWGFFGSWGDYASFISMSFHNGQYRGFSYMPTYYITGQFSRYIRPGFRNVTASQSQAGPVLTSSYTGAGKLVVVAVNTAPVAERLRLTVRHATLGSRVRATRTSRTDHWRKLRAVPASKRSFTAMLAPQSVTTFVTSERPASR